ncbi:MAG TPA: cardiolipin synthase [Thermoanaerobaculia bacterium]|nr:cardiolipin synthase [Thermoanaerobaculia bacterium]
MRFTTSFLQKNDDGDTVVAVPLALFVGMIVFMIVLILILWSVKRRRDAEMHVVRHESLADLVPSLAGLTHGSVHEGNDLEILQNGDAFFSRLLEDLRSAKETIHFEAFLWEKGAICDEIAATLAARARHGVEVRLLLDASGSRKMDRRLLTMMQDAGCEVRRFHPHRLSNLGLINNRDHRKIVVIDGRIGYVGGHCISEEWTGNAQDKNHYRDTSVRAEGPIVNSLQSAFTENWSEETGDVLAGARYFPPPRQAGGTAAHLAYVSASGTVSAVQILYYLAIESASERITIQNPYFLPDPEALEALAEAVRRGVEVRVMLPSVRATDSSLVQHASHHHFGSLLERGVKVYEYDKTLLHQKVMVIDGEWASVGSTNFDDRSFEINDEVSLGIIDVEIARQLEEAFERDLEHCIELKLDAWKQRPIGHKLIDGFAYLFNEQL